MSCKRKTRNEMDLAYFVLCQVKPKHFIGLIFSKEMGSKNLSYYSISGIHKVLLAAR